MDRNRTVAGLDVHKDSIYLCIMGHDEVIIFEKKYGVLTPDLRQMCNDMVERGVTETAMESIAVYWVPPDLDISACLRDCYCFSRSNVCVRQSAAASSTCVSAVQFSDFSIL